MKEHKIYTDGKVSAIINDKNVVATGGCLKLTVHRQWFILGYHGAKLNEYREFSDHWISRLLEKNKIDFRQYSEVEFRNGYGDHRPVYRRKFIKTELGQAFRRKKLEAGYILSMPNRHFKITLGEITHEQNIPENIKMAVAYCQGCQSLSTIEDFKAAAPLHHICNCDYKHDLIPFAALKAARNESEVSE